MGLGLRPWRGQGLPQGLLEGGHPLQLLPAAGQGLATAGRPQLSVGGVEDLLDPGPGVGLGLAGRRGRGGGRGGRDLGQLAQAQQRFQGQGIAPLQGLQIRECQPATLGDGLGLLGSRLLDQPLGQRIGRKFGPGEGLVVSKVEGLGQVGAEAGGGGVGGLGIESPAGKLAAPAATALQQPVHLLPLGIDVQLHRHQLHEGGPPSREQLLPILGLRRCQRVQQQAGGGGEQAPEIGLYIFVVAMEIEIIKAIHLAESIFFPIQFAARGAQQAGVEVAGEVTAIAEHPARQQLLHTEPAVDGIPFLIGAPIAALPHQTHQLQKLPQLQGQMIRAGVDRPEQQKGPQGLDRLDGRGGLPVHQAQHAIESLAVLRVASHNRSQAGDAHFQLAGPQPAHSGVVERKLRQGAIEPLLPLAVHPGPQQRAGRQHDGWGAFHQGEGHRHPVGFAGAGPEAKPFMVVVVKMASGQGIEQLALMPQQADEHQQQGEMGPADPGPLRRVPGASARRRPCRRCCQEGGNRLRRQLGVATKGLPIKRFCQLLHAANQLGIAAVIQCHRLGIGGLPLPRHRRRAPGGDVVDGQPSRNGLGHGSGCRGGGFVEVEGKHHVEAGIGGGNHVVELDIQYPGQLGVGVDLHIQQHNTGFVQ